MSYAEAQLEPFLHDNFLYFVRCKSNAMVLFLKVREPETEKLVPKRKRRKERVQEAKQTSSLQVSRKEGVGIFTSFFHCLANCCVVFVLFLLLLLRLSRKQLPHSSGFFYLLPLWRP